MAGRKKSPAALRTIGLFTGMTALEEAERELKEEREDASRGPAARDYDSTKEADIATAVRWLGMDAFEDGDDVMLALSKKGDGVLLVIRTSKNGTPSHQCQVRLSRKQLTKLKTIASQIP